jgi:SAM-dependent methyltransferase
MSNLLHEFKANWSYKLFVKHPELFLPILEEESKHASREVSGLCRILRDLNVSHQARILDLSCGIGRHSILLAKMGFKVVGYDPSRYYISIARKRAKSEISTSDHKLHFFSGEPGRPGIILLKNNERNFEIILSLFQSIGYISREYDLLMLKNLRKVTSSKCLLILETENKQWRLNNFEKNKINHYGKVIVREKWKFDFKNDVFKNQTMFYTKREKERNSHLVLDLHSHMILYSLEELKKITTKAGWKFFRNYHSIRSLKPATSQSSMPISVFTML